MLNEKLLAMEGYVQHLDKTAQVQNSLALIKDDLMTEQLFKDDVMASISMDAKDVSESVQQDLKHIRVRWLFRDSLQSIRNVYSKLKNGVSFDGLFKAQLTDSVRADDRSLETTLFKLKQKNPVLMSIIDTLTSGTVSRPIKVDDGFYILKVASGWNDVLLTQTEWANRLEKMRHALFKLKMDSLSDVYVNTLLFENKPVIRKKEFRLVLAWLAKLVLPKKTVSSWRFLNDPGKNDLQNIEKMLFDDKSSELVSLIHGRFSVKDFITWYHARKGYIKLPQTTRENFSKAVQNIIWRMVRDKLLTRRALQRGLENRPDIVRQMSWWKDKIVFSKYKLNLADSIKITDQEVLNFYNNNKQSYTSKNGVLQPFSEVKTEIKNSLRRDKYSSKLIHSVLAAKQKYKIKINQQLLNTIEVDSENDPRSIDVYTVKKGGLIPRQPYPTIDSEWKYWY